jgi:hypothetical protein
LAMNKLPMVKIPGNGMMMSMKKMRPKRTRLLLML